MQKRERCVPIGTGAQWATEHLLPSGHHYNNVHENGEKNTSGNLKSLLAMPKYQLFVKLVETCQFFFSPFLCRAIVLDIQIIKPTICTNVLF